MPNAVQGPVLSLRRYTYPREEKRITRAASVYRQYAATRRMKKNIIFTRGTMNVSGSGR